MNFRPLRGRAVVIRDPEELGEVTRRGIVIPATISTNPRTFRIHRGIVVALGSPAFEHELTGVERPWSCKVGDVVHYTMAVALERVRSFEDFVDWRNAVVIAQEEIQAVGE